MLRTYGPGCDGSVIDPKVERIPDDLPILEAPMTTVQYFGRNFPCSGGGYFRLLPYWLSRMNMNRVNSHDRQPCIFYFHPWEIDPDQPRQENVSAKSRFRHYTGLGSMAGRLERLLRDFAWGRVDEVFAEVIAPGAGCRAAAAA